MILYVEESSGVCRVYGKDSYGLTTEKFHRPGQLYGYTSTTVSVKNSNTVRVYNEAGSEIKVFTINN
jgi:hypothetical protein